MNPIYYIENKDFFNFVQHLIPEYEIFFPALKENPAKDKPDYIYEKLLSAQALSFNPYRAVSSLRQFFTSALEGVAKYFVGSNDIILDSQKKVIVFGVKSCDLVGQKIQDFVFLEGVGVDSSYRFRREKTILVSGDCTDFKAVCHCLAWEVMPYPLSGFDLNLSCLNDGYLVEIGSSKADMLIKQYHEYFVLAKQTQIAAREAKRQALVEALKKFLLPQNLIKSKDAQRLVKEGYALDTWKEFMQTCVECGGCNFICGTCHCFLLSDQRQEEQNIRLRQWDACLYANFARVAGGANPLKLRSQRLRNRFMKKFDFFVDNLGIPACCGCGRCIEVCPGKIDIREVFKDLERRLSCSK